MDFTLTEAQRALQDTARRLAEEVFAPRAEEYDRSETYPYENIPYLVRAGFMGMSLPTEYGGGGRPLLDAILVVEEIAAACATTGRIVVEGNTGAALAIAHYGSSEQKGRWLPLVVQGEKPCIAITEPEAGSAATELTTSARLVDGHYILNGVKRFITGAGVSRLYLVFARFGEGKGAEGIGGIVVERGTPGFTFGRRWPMMGIRGMPEGELVFVDCPVPQGNLLVPPEEGGFRKLMTAYNSQRVGAAAAALGVAQGAFRRAVDYAQKRRQFGQPIANFQGIQWLLADMFLALEAARLLVYRAAANAGYGFPDMQEAALAKTFAAEMAIQVTNNALQIHGAYGYSRDLPLERMVRDARMFSIGGGTTQVMRNLIARGILGRK
ncbi:MAG: acyl-CoA dehydrogenase family protein [Dehalococcoidia bacterium]